MMYLAAYLLADSCGKTGIDSNMIMSILKSVSIGSADQGKAEEVVNKLRGKSISEWAHAGEVSLSALSGAVSAGPTPAGGSATGGTTSAAPAAKDAPSESEEDSDDELGLALFD
ncbi:hypothetical protein GJ496_006533 [Pomphorhynchus laevis]|nr:hypothetical protein GJ496_006533 [Pomphorhynchus laevis]